VPNVEGISWEAGYLKESQDGTIDVPEEEPATIKLLMQYLYEGE
jgi:hypothetical protein